MNAAPTTDCPTPCRPKTGWLSDETYCAIHGRVAGWPCSATRATPPGLGGQR